MMIKQKEKIKKLKSKTYLIIGYGKFGKGFANRLLKEGVKEGHIYIIDHNKDMLVEAKTHFTNVMEMTVYDFDTITTIDLNDIDVVVIAMSELESSLMIAANCNKYYDKKYYAKAKNEIHAKILRNLGVQEVVIPELEIGSRLAYKSLFKDNIEIKEEENYNLVSITIENTKNLEKKTLAQLHFRTSFNCNIFGINRNNVFIIPSGNDVILKNDTVNIVCKKEDTNNIIKFFNG